MGWKNGVQYCQRNLEVALADVADIASGYVDDILIGTRRDNLTDSTKDLILKHDREVRLVMEQLLKHRLVASYNKAQLFRAVARRHLLRQCGTLQMLILSSEIAKAGAENLTPTPLNIWRTAGRRPSRRQPKKSPFQKQNFPLKTRVSSSPFFQKTIWASLWPPGIF